MGKPIVFFDLETTGLSPSKDRIIQISCLKHFEDGSNKVVTKLINPGIPITEEAIQVHGITNEMLKNEPPFSAYAASMFEFFQGCDVGGYNMILFDIPFLREEFLRCGFDWHPLRDGARMVDVYKLICLAMPRKLEDVFNMFFPDQELQAHDAEADVIATLQILEQLRERKQVCINLEGFLGKDIDEIHSQSMDGSDFLDYAGKIMRNGSRIEFSFGKNKGKRLIDVPNYCKWMLTADFPEDTKQIIKSVLSGDIS